MQRGQLNAGLVWGVVGMLVAVAIGGLVYSEIDDATSDAVNTGEFNIAGVDTWTMENQYPIAVSFNSSDGWLDVTATSSVGTDNVGSATVYETLSDVDTHRSIEDATATLMYQIVTDTDLNKENIEIRLEDPSGNTDTVKSETGLTSATGWTTLEVDVSDYIDEDGDYKLTVYTQVNVAKTGNFETNIDNVELDIDTETIGEFTQKETGEGAETIFPLLIVIVIVAVIVAVMKLFGSV